jgi:hypothetical protein
MSLIISFFLIFITAFLINIRKRRQPMSGTIKKLITSGKDGINNMATIIEEEGPRHILLRALQAGDGISLDVIDLDNRDFTQDRVIRISSDATFLQGPQGPPGEAGDALTLVNRGGGRELFLNKTGTDLNIRTLTAGPGIVLTQNAETIRIETTPTTVSLLPVNQGGTGKNSVMDNSVLVGKNNQYIEKNATQKYQTLAYDGVDLNWMRLFIPVTMEVNFNATQQIDSVHSTTDGVSPVVLSATSFSFTNPYTSTIPYGSFIYGYNIGQDKWISRNFTNVMRFEWTTSNPNNIVVIGCTPNATGSSTPGIARIVFLLGPN